MGRTGRYVHVRQARMVSVLGDIAAVSGTVKGRAAAAETAELLINGQHVAIDLSGTFSAIVKLDGEPDLTLWLATDAGEPGHDGAAGAGDCDTRGRVAVARTPASARLVAVGRPRPVQGKRPLLLHRS
jgi:hypothetical protein